MMSQPFQEKLTILPVVACSLVIIPNNLCLIVSWSKIALHYISNMLYTYTLAVSKHYLLFINSSFSISNSGFIQRTILLQEQAHHLYDTWLLISCSCCICFLGNNHSKTDMSLQSIWIY